MTVLPGRQSSTTFETNVRAACVKKRFLSVSEKGTAVKLCGAKRSQLEELPDELLSLILQRLASSCDRPQQVINAWKTCKRMHLVGSSEEVLRRLAPAALQVTVPEWLRGSGAASFLRKCAEAGNAHAAYTLGMILFYCLKERRQGFRYLVSAAASDHPEALHAVSIVHFNGSTGDRTNRNPAVAVALAARAAAAGNVAALKELGHCLIDGYGIERNAAEGRSILLRASKLEGLKEQQRTVGAQRGRRGAEASCGSGKDSRSDAGSSSVHDLERSNAHAEPSSRQPCSSQTANQQAAESAEASARASSGSAWYPCGDAIRIGATGNHACEYCSSSNPPVELSGDFIEWGGAPSPPNQHPSSAAVPMIAEAYNPVSPSVANLNQDAGDLLNSAPFSGGISIGGHSTPPLRRTLSLPGSAASHRNARGCEGAPPNLPAFAAMATVSRYLRAGHPRTPVDWMRLPLAGEEEEEHLPRTACTCNETQVGECSSARQHVGTLQLLTEGRADSGGTKTAARGSGGSGGRRETRRDSGPGQPSSGFDIHGFMMDWHQRFGLPAGLNLCGNRACGRAEGRSQEFRCCSACCLVPYCSRACQAEDWRRGGHKGVCGMLAELGEDNPQLAPRQVMQLFLVHALVFAE